MFSMHRSRGVFFVLFVLSTAHSQSPRLEELHTSLPGYTELTSCIISGDLDGDGDLDLIVGSGYGVLTTGSERVLRNDGRGHFMELVGAIPEPPPGVGDILTIALGDVDGDGDLDGYFVRSYGKELLLGNGSGGFQRPPIPAPSPFDLTKDVAMGDVDGDLDLDIVMAGRGAEVLLLNDGTGTFTQVPNRIPRRSDESDALLLEDFDGDSDLDILVGNRDVQPAALYLNDGNGTFSDASALLPSLPGETHDLAAGDVDGDGDLDVLLGEIIVHAHHPNRLWLNDGNARFTEVVGAFTQSRWTGAVALVDVDADGDLDAIFGNDYFGDELHLNDGSGGFVDRSNLLPSPVVANSWTRALVAADLDRDGDPDLLLGRRRAQDLLLLNDGTGRFTNETGTFPAMDYGAHCAAVGDVDGDGILDLLAGSSPILAFRHDGAGRFTPTTVGSVPFGFHPIDLRLVDLDGDSDLDAIAAHRYGASLFVNDGSGGFSDRSSTLPSGPPDGASLEVGDVDADSDLDIVLGTRTDGTWLLRNDGSSVFTPSRVSDAGAEAIHGLALGDVDGDGDLDLIEGRSPSLPGSFGYLNRIYRNDGQGNFTRQLQAFSFASSTVDIVLGDVDGDGDLDVFEANTVQDVSQPGLLNRLHRNDGSGRFLDVTSSHLPPNMDHTWGACLVDLDADSDLDLVLANERPDESVVLLNDGTGRFSEPTFPIVAGRPASVQDVVAGDFDADGDTDLFFASDQACRLYHNLRYQLTWRTRAHLGRPLEMSLHAPGSGAWQLGASLRRTRIELPPFGTLWLSPAELIPVATGALPPSGRDSISFHVPSDPSFLGTAVHWQAILAFPVTLSSLETTTIRP